MAHLPTPGPWQIHEPKDDTYHDISIKHGQRTVCRLWQEGRYASGTNAEQWANARLIAAAPDLLEALKHIYEFGRHDDDAIVRALARVAGDAIDIAVGEGA